MAISLIKEEADHILRVLIQEMRLGFESMRKELHLRISTLGSRWGKKAEDTFRNALKELLAKKLEVKQIEPWQTFDEEGKGVFHPFLHRSRYLDKEQDTLDCGVVR